MARKSKHALPYLPTDTMSDLYIKFFREHNREMMFRTHGYFKGWCQYVPIGQAINLIKIGFWEERKKDLFVCTPIQ